MERSGPLNEQQLETLRLIGAGDDLSSEQHVKRRNTLRYYIHSPTTCFPYIGNLDPKFTPWNEST